MTKIGAKGPQGLCASHLPHAQPAKARAEEAPAKPKGWAAKHWPSPREVLNAVSTKIDRAVGLDTAGPKPITMGPVDEKAFASMEAKVAQLDQPTTLDAKTRARLDKGEIISTNKPRADGTVEEKTMGVVDVPLEKFLEKVPTKDWGKNLVDYMGGEVKSAGPGRQIERMVLNMPGKDLDMTKVESLKEDRDASGKLQGSRVLWEVLKSDNGTVKQDTGTLRFERYGDKTLVTWHSAHALEKFPTATALLPKGVADKAVGMVLSDYFSRAIENYRDLATR